MGGQRYRNPNWRGPAKGYDEGLKAAAARDVSSAIGALEGTVARWLERCGSGAGMGVEEGGGMSGQHDEALRQGSWSSSSRRGR